MMSNGWIDRDTAVVPWISLRNSADDGAISTVGGAHHDASSRPPATAKTNNGSHNTANTRSSCKILSLLGARERIGSKGQCGNRIGWLSEGVVVTNDALARAGAW